MKIDCFLEEKHAKCALKWMPVMPWLSQLKNISKIVLREPSKPCIFVSALFLLFKKYECGILFKMGRSYLKRRSYLQWSIMRMSLIFKSFFIYFLYSFEVFFFFFFCFHIVLYSSFNINKNSGSNKAESILLDDLELHILPDSYR